VINLIAANQRQQAIRDVALDASVKTSNDQSQTDSILSENKQFLTVMKIQAAKTDTDYKQFADTVRRVWG